MLMKKKLSLLIVAFMALAAYAGLNAWRTAGETKSLTVDFEKAVSEYSDWTFTNITTQKTNSGVNAHGGSYFGTTDGKTKGSIATKEKVANPKAIQFFISKLSTNTTASSWLVEVSANGTEWTQVGDAQSASSDITKGKWTEVNRDLSAYKNVYIRISYDGTTANRTIDDVTLSYTEESGEGETGDTKMVYLKPGVWNADGARFAAYLFKGEENTWVDFSSTPGADGSTGTYFKADIPVSYTSMILVRMKSGTTENNWDNKWNQTDDIDITELADKTLYRITGWGSGSNSPYDTTTWPEQSTDPDPQTEQVTWTVAGNNEALFGTAWAPALEANDMTLEDGVYKWEKENVTLLAGDVEFKVAKNHSWDEAYPEQNYAQSIEVGGIYTFTITFNADTKDIRVAAVKTGGITTTGELNSLADKTAFTYFGDAVVVAKPTAKYVYIADERGGSLIYDKNSVGTAAAEVGKTIATPWSGTVSIYNGLFEAIPDAALAVKDGEAVPVTYQEVDATYLTADNVNKVVKLKGLTITAIDGKYITFKQGDADVAGYNQFGLQLSTEQVGKTYDVVGAIGRYNDNIQFQPISMEEAATPVTINSMYIVGELTGGWPDTETGDWSMAKEMTKSADNPNIWTLTVAEFEAEAKEYQYKATANGKYGDYELPAEGNKTYTFTEAGKYSLLFTADTEKHELTLEAKKIETEVTYTVAGAFYYGDPATEVIIFGGDKSWDPSLTANDMTKGEDNLYHFKKEDVELVAAGNVQLKVVKDHSFDIASYPEKNKEIAITAAGKYDIEVTFNPETKEVTATATSKDTPEPATISKVEIRGGIGGDWDKKPIQLTLAPGDPNVYYAVLDASEFTEDFEFKMLVNGDAESETDKIWLGFKEMTLTDPNKWVTPKKEEFGSNLNFANSTSGYQTYHFKAKWTPSAVASAGWELQITEGDPRTAPAPEFIVLGNNAEIFGKAWDTESTTNTMELKDGKYYRTYTKVQPQETAIELKAYNKTNNTWYGNKKDGQNVKFNMKAEGDFTVVLDVNADFTAGNVEVTGDNVEMIYPEPEQPGDATWTVAGDNTTLFGEAWNPALTANDMVKGEDGLYKWEKTEATLPAGSVEFKVVKNHAWGEEYPKDGNYKLTIPENGKYTVTITFNPETKVVAATATKTGEAIIPDAEITSVQLPGDWNWALEKGEDNVEPYLVLTKGENNTWTGVLDLTEVTVDQEFKLNVNKDNANWLGVGELKLDAGELVSTEQGEGNNFILKNATSGYQTYNVTATWEANASAKNGWTLKIEGKDARPVVTEPVYTLVGAFYDGDGKESASFFGESWKVLEANNLEKIYDGFYKKEYTGINLEKGDVSLKVLKDGDWEHPYPNADGYKLEIPSAGVYDLTFTFHLDESVVRGEADKKSEPIEITRMDIVGDFTGGWPSKDETSGEWDWSKAKAMTQDATNPAIWTLTVEGFKAEAKTYEYKATANGQYGVYELPASGNNNWVFGTEAYPAGKYDLLFTANTADNSLTVVPTLTEVETVILDEEETLAENQVLEVEEPFTSDEITVEDGQIITIEADEAGESLVPRRAFRALAASDITIQYKPEAGSGWQDAPVTVETNETGYQFEVTGAVATAINNRGFAIKANKPIVVTQVAVVTEVTPDPEPEPVYYAVGVKALWGTEWAIDEANKLTLNGEGKYTITKTDLTLDANTNYGYKVVKVVGEAQTWIPDGMGNEKNLTVDERAVYSVTLTLDPAEPLTAESFTAVATKTGEAEPAADAEITKVELRGEFTSWSDGEGVELTKQGETDTYAGVLDLSEITADQAFKLVINDKTYWIDFNHLSLVAPDGWLVKESGDVTEPAIILTNASTGYKTYNVTATWTPSPNAAAGWKLEIAGKDQRGDTPAEPVYYAVGVKALWGVNDWTVDEANKLTLNGEGKYTITKTELTLDANTNYGYKVVKKVGDTQYWIPDGMDNENNLTVTERAVYSVTLTLDPAEPLTAESFTAVATKTGEAEPAADAEITKVELRGEFTSWSDGEGVELTKQGETDTYAGVLDLSEITADQAFKLVINDKTYWIDFNHLSLVAPDGWLVKESGDVTEPAIILTNASTGYKTYNVTATWTPSPNAAAGWTLTVAGKDLREPAPEANYYIVGSMTDWQTNEAYKLTLNEAAEAGIVEYKITLDLEANAEFKVAKSDDGIHVYDADWYPTGMDNNYMITKTSNYTVYFRPNGDGGDDWHYHYIYAQDNNPTGINGVKADALKDAEVYTINGQRVQNPTKGLYIVNGKKVVIK